jgi:hypothetical protein
LFGEVMWRYGGLAKRKTSVEEKKSICFGGVVLERDYGCRVLSWSLGTRVLVVGQIALVKSVCTVTVGLIDRKKKICIALFI